LASKKRRQSSASKEIVQESASKRIKQDLVSEEKKQDKRKNTTNQQRKRCHTVAFGSEDCDNTELNNDGVGMKKKKQKTLSEVVYMLEKKNTITENVSDEKEGPSCEGNNEDTQQVDNGLLEGTSSAAEMIENTGSGSESVSEWEDHEGTPHRQTVKKQAVKCPICGRKFTSLSRLYQFHYSEGSKTCPGPKRKPAPRQNIKKGSYACPSCGKIFTSLARLNQYHYNATTKTCSSKTRKNAVTCYSDGVNAALCNPKTSEQELYAAISEVTYPPTNHDVIFHCRIHQLQNAMLFGGVY